MMLISQKHIATLAPYDDFTFALATPPSSSSSSFSSSSAESPIHSTPAVTYHDLTRSPTPANHRTIREVGATRRVHFTTFLLQDSGHAHSAATAPAPTSVSREDLVHALSLLLRRYADAADLAAEVLEAMSEPLGKPHAAWCMGIHRSVREVVKRRLEIVRTFNRELMRLADLERTGHIPRGWKTFSRPGGKRATISGRRRRRRSATPPRPSPTVSEDAEGDDREPGQEPSLSPLLRPTDLPVVQKKETPDESDWTGSIQCGGIHFVSEWVFRVTRLIVSEGFPSTQETEDAEALVTARSELARLQHGMTLDKMKPTSPPPPPYPTAKADAPGESRRRSLSLARYRSIPEKPAEKGRDMDVEMAVRVGVCQYIRHLLIGPQ